MLFLWGGSWGLRGGVAWRAATYHLVYAGENGRFFQRSEHSKVQAGLDICFFLRGSLAPKNTKMNGHSISALGPVQV